MRSGPRDSTPGAVSLPGEPPRDRPGHSGQPQAGPSPWCAPSWRQGLVLTEAKLRAPQTAGRPRRMPLPRRQHGGAGCKQKGCHSTPLNTTGTQKRGDEKNIATGTGVFHAEPVASALISNPISLGCPKRWQCPRVRV